VLKKSHGGIMNRVWARPAYHEGWSGRKRWLNAASARLPGALHKRLRAWWSLIFRFGTEAQHLGWHFVAASDTPLRRNGYGPQAPPPLWAASNPGFIGQPLLQASGTAPNKADHSNRHRLHDRQTPRRCW
jgi:hypothetical protein